MTRWKDENAFDTPIRTASAKYGVPVPLIKGVIAHESGFNMLALRKEPARPTLPPTNDFPQGGDESRGLMQLLTRTARALGFTGPIDMLYNPDIAIDLGTKLLRDNLARANGHVDVALSAYNAGWSSARADDAKRVGGPGSAFINQDYVDRVLSYADYFKGQEPTNAQATPSALPIVWPSQINPLFLAGGVALLVGIAWWVTHR